MLCVKEHHCTVGPVMKVKPFSGEEDTIFPTKYYAMVIGLLSIISFLQVVASIFYKLAPSLSVPVVPVLLAMVLTRLGVHRYFAARLLHSVTEGRTFFWGTKTSFSSEFSLRL